jgi:hypothetical protein
MQTSLFLILGTVVMFAAFFFIYPARPDELARHQTLDLMTDTTLAKAGIVLGYGGAVAMIVGLLGVSRTMFMAGGSGASYGNIAFVLFVALVASMIARACIELGVTGASTMASGLLLSNVENAMASTTPLVMGVAMTLLGLGIYFAKNFHVGVGGIAIIAGVINIVRPFADNNNLDLAGLVGFGILALAVGISKMRASA